MSDLFHHLVPFQFIKEIWMTMAACPQHTFIVLTKRAKLMQHAVTALAEGFGFAALPTNVWGMVTVENQDQMWRIEELLQTPFAVRGVSCEPLLGAIDISPYLSCEWHAGSMVEPRKGTIGGKPMPAARLRPSLSWVIVGGESGPGARPMHPDWARGLQGQCQAAGVPFFFKQMGGWVPNEEGCGDFHFNSKHICLNAAGEQFDGWIESHGKRIAIMAKASKKAAGRLLNGREWNEFPEVAP